MNDLRLLIIYVLTHSFVPLWNVFLMLLSDNDSRYDEPFGSAIGIYWSDFAQTIVAGFVDIDDVLI